MRILVDTNVLISAYVYGGKPRALIHRLLGGEHTMVVTSYIDREFREKLRQKWPLIMEKILSMYEMTYFRHLESTDERYGELRDLKDIPVLSDAIYHRIDVILTGDRDFLEADLKRPIALSVSMLWDYLDEEDAGK